MSFWITRTPQHVIDGAKQSQINYRRHLIGLSMIPIGADYMYDDDGNLMAWTQVELDNNAAELARVDAEIAKF